MKNLTLLAAALTLAGSASAATSTANVKFEASVSNTCRLIGTSAALPAGNLGTVNAPKVGYTALAANTASLSSGLVIECTKGTNPTITAAPAAGYGLTGTNGMVLKKAGGTDVLQGTYKLTETRVASTGQMVGDRVGGAVSFTPTGGQWGAPAGTYEGVLTVTFEYN